jgi:DNA-binding transcriptional ArsR family regulator
MSSIFTAIADPVRRDILGALLGGEQTVNALVERLAIAQPSVSKHLGTLREAGLVRTRIDGPRRYYSLDVAPLGELDHWLATYRAFWEQRLDALDEHLKRSQ